MKDTLSPLRAFQERLLETLNPEHRQQGHILDQHCLWQDDAFNEAALELAFLQGQANPHFGALLAQNRSGHGSLAHWHQIPCVPTHVYKAFEWSCIPEDHRTSVFHSSGTTRRQTSRHWHSEVSLQLYETLLLAWCREHLPWGTGTSESGACIFLTPEPGRTPHSSLAHMFATIAFALKGKMTSRFLGDLSAAHQWTLPLEETVRVLSDLDRPVHVFGTAFLFVHLLDYLAREDRQLTLPAGSLLFETGGYKGQSRELSKQRFHEDLATALGIRRERILCEYGMSELSSQAYDLEILSSMHPEPACRPRYFRFPPWARVRVISPETGSEVGIGETGMVHVIDLANVWSSVSVLTEDIAVRQHGGFELLGRLKAAEQRGCSLLSADLA